MRNTLTSVALALAALAAAMSPGCGKDAGLPAPAAAPANPIAQIPGPGVTGAETKEEKDARMNWWRQARFGMFVHWGVYSVPAGIWDGKTTPRLGEWIMHDLKIPVAEYMKFPAQFNPVKFSADDFVLTAKKAGMKYIVITAKHHDGFAMFETKVGGGWNIMDATPYKRDPLKELAAACNKYGMKLGFYYSQCQDWHQPGGAAAGGHWDTAQDGNYDDYLKNVAVPQVRELLSNYGPVAVLWFDTPEQMTPARAALFSPVLKLQPGIVVNNRLGGGFNGDTETPEQRIPATGYKDRDWETCMTINGTWGFKSTDTNWKPTATLLKNLIDIASKGGNYLLNVGPTSEGLIPQASLDRLGEIGKWMDKNGEAIYGTTASPFAKYSFDGRATVKGNMLYLHVYTWPAEGLKVEGLANSVKEARFLADGAKVNITTGTSAGGIPTLTIAPPAKADAIATVVALTLDGPPQVGTPAASAVAPSADGSLSLKAIDARIVGETAKYEADNGRDAIGYWTNKNDYVEWTVQVPASKAYQVVVTYACDTGSPGSTYSVAVGGKAVDGAVASTGGWTEFKTETVGRLELTAGSAVVSVKPKLMPRGAVMNLKEVRLVPAN